MQITAQMVKELRDETGLPIMECKSALVAAAGDKEKAKEILRRRGSALAAKRSARSTAQGVVDAYIHFNNRVGVMLEVNCETDFVAQSADFRKLVADLAQHIAMNAPEVVAPEDLDADILARERALLMEQMVNVPEQKREQAAEGKLRKTLYAEKCLLEQPFVWDETITVRQMLEALVAKTGENIRIRRFVRYALGS